MSENYYKKYLHSDLYYLRRPREACLAKIPDCNNPDVNVKMSE